MPDIPLRWSDLQRSADALLAQGICALRRRLETGATPLTISDPGNYLFSLAGRPMYIGEGGNLAARLRQQLAVRTSTFYKNYVKSGAADPQPISAFSLQFMTACLGRKEIEDFGIANIPTPLNRFQLDKRAVRAATSTTEDWDRTQAAAADLLAQGEARFWDLRPVPLHDAGVPDAPGLYALWTDSPRRVVYIGESSGLRERHKTHTSYTYFSALRRNVGTNLLGFELHEIRGKRRYFTDDEEHQLDAFLRQCRYQCMVVKLGRLELEERLIARQQPVADRKGTGRTAIPA